MKNKTWVTIVIVLIIIAMSVTFLAFQLYPYKKGADTVNQVKDITEATQELQQETSSDLLEATANATYTIGGQEITLTDGKNEEQIPNSSATIITGLTDNMINGELNGDEVDDAGVILIQQPGGSGTFYYVASTYTTEDGYQGSNAILLGDRIKIKSIMIFDEVITVDYLDRGENEAMAVEPTVEVSRQFTLEDNNLLEIK